MSLLGERLRQAREARGISTYQVEIDTRIRGAVIEAMEQGNFDVLPPEPFLRGLVRNYSAYLGVDPEEMLLLYVADMTPPPPPPPVPPVQITRSPIPEPSPPPPPVVPQPETEPPVEPPRKKISAPPLMPKPTEPPEQLVFQTPPEEAGGRTLAHSTRRPAPLIVIILMLLAALVTCLVSSFLVSSQVATFLANFQPTQTPTRLLPTRTPTLAPGALPTGIPTIAATAPPMATLRSSPSPTAKVTPRRTLEVLTGLNLDIDVAQVVAVEIGIDGVMVFNGPLQPGTSRTWSAKDTLYIRIDNPKGATLTLNGNGKWFAARNFAETRSLERQFSLNDKGVPVSETPAAPPTLAPSQTPQSNIPLPVAPTPTLTPFS